MAPRDPSAECWQVIAPNGHLTGPVAFNEALRRLSREMYIRPAEQIAAVIRMQQGETTFRFVYGDALGEINKQDTQAK